ncbi:MAG: BolA/IbaG family iron-sulfur metabolism protein [Sulfurimicrobium sp.]|nr:BolA/IbaG family iron-sulfur metabolism protein [Sulfurimicrobium sp.]MDO9190112.1 BolA/IbaG family iron-sulfur metabolism protein [Sulfurimicrobium sp.]MDP1704725.1 BolA/IbaG family iron-sulfur metabolism protein [Sulfurimicrobium sp.]MDP2199603.1 BolA/IbaG family iron-sulfur metabolism protein [Sulfurimicrobium sp.]MDP2963936.1 BolA/IbaG family iron-sulfur metabolism protein [Sulfurimicrobium sp.]
MVTADQIKQYIQNDLPCEYVRVDGDDGQHFEAIIVSAEFNGKRMVQQHQLVYKALGERMGGEIHALAMKTFTPEEWRKQAG